MSAMHLRLIGGTRFLGRHLVERALVRGRAITLRLMRCTGGRYRHSEPKCRLGSS
jgi:hypothetical protein